MPQGIIQFKEGDSPAERERKLNDVVKLFDTEIKALKNKLVKAEEEIEFLKDSDLN